jgi:DNA-binding FadR family transcriptional regulator
VRVVKQPRLAEMIASDLRDGIISGELADGDSLPTLDRLMERFRVSAPSIREALRILENEGLITVRRGNVGGAVVHHPRPSAAAYMLGLVLEFQHVRVADLAAAMLELEPTCVALCAGRDDRATTIVPKLRDALDKAEADVSGNPLQFGMNLVRFHEIITYECGNDTMILVVGALGALWASQAVPWPHKALQDDDHSPAKLRGMVKKYRDVLAAVEAGDAPLASKRLRAVLADPDTLKATRSGRNPVIKAANLPPSLADNGRETARGA